MSKKNTGFRRRRQPTQSVCPSKRIDLRKENSGLSMDAIESATTGGMSGNSAAAKYGVPPSTLKDHLSGQVKHGTNPGPAPYLSLAEEKDSLTI